MLIIHIYNLLSENAAANCLSMFCLIHWSFNIGHLWNMYFVLFYIPLDLPSKENSNWL